MICYWDHKRIGISCNISVFWLTCFCLSINMITYLICRGNMYQSTKHSMCILMYGNVILRLLADFCLGSQMHFILSPRRWRYAIWVYGTNWYTNSIWTMGNEYKLRRCRLTPYPWLSVIHFRPAARFIKTTWHTRHNDTVLLHMHTPPASVSLKHWYIRSIMRHNTYAISNICWCHEREQGKCILLCH